MTAMQNKSPFAFTRGDDDMVRFRVSKLSVRHVHASRHIIYFIELSSDVGGAHISAHSVTIIITRGNEKENLFATCTTATRRAYDPNVRTSVQVIFFFNYRAPGPYPRSRHYNAHG